MKYFPCFLIFSFVSTLFAINGSTKIGLNNTVFDAPCIGDTVKFKSGLEFSIIKYEFTKGDGMFQAKSNEVFLVLDIYIGNMGSKAYIFSSLAQTFLLDKDDYKYSNTSFYKTKSHISEGEIPSSSKIEGQISFTVPTSAVITRLRFKYDSFNDKYIDVFISGKAVTYHRICANIFVDMQKDPKYTTRNEYMKSIIYWGLMSRYYRDHYFEQEKDLVIGNDKAFYASVPYVIAVYGQDNDILGFVAIFLEEYKILAKNYPDNNMTKSLASWVENNKKKLIADGWDLTDLLIDGYEKLGTDYNLALYAADKLSELCAKNESNTKLCTKTLKAVKNIQEATKNNGK